MNEAQKQKCERRKKSTKIETRFWNVYMYVKCGENNAFFDSTMDFVLLQQNKRRKIKCAMYGVCAMCQFR